MSNEDLFLCPECNGPHFNITAKGMLCCTQCSWEGFNRFELNGEKYFIKSVHVNDDRNLTIFGDDDG